MAYFPVEDLLKKTHNSMYKLVILAAKRAQELGQGSEKLVDVDSPNTKLTTIALKEIKEGKISYKEKKA